MSVHADPDELERFAQTLSGFCESVNEELRQLNAGFATLSESWADVKQREFEEMLRDLSRQFSHFTEASAENVRYLRQQAERLRAYLSA